jgi:hypothetical protein
VLLLLLHRPVHGCLPLQLRDPLGHCLQLLEQHLLIAELQLLLLLQLMLLEHQL